MGVKIKQIIEDLCLEVIFKGNLEKEIDTSDVNRPGLQFAGYYDYFGEKRLQVLGMAEWSYLDKMSYKIREDRLNEFCSFDLPCIILSRNLEPHYELLKECKRYNIPLLRSDKVTTRLISKLMHYLDRELAMTTVIHGVLADIHGLGIMITGKSGIGKSETALELIKRGHRLVTDDAVNIKKIDDILYGSSPDITKGMLEVRGVGIIDVSSLYGLSSIIEEKPIDLVIELEQWDDSKSYERLGVNEEFIDILGTKVKQITLPIRPGRNLAIIIETAAVNYRYQMVSKESPVDIIERRMQEINNR